jgi:hypothetical protein
LFCRRILSPASGAETPANGGLGREAAVAAGLDHTRQLGRSAIVVEVVQLGQLAKGDSVHEHGVNRRGKRRIARCALATEKAEIHGRSAAHLRTQMTLGKGAVIVVGGNVKLETTEKMAAFRRYA